MKHVYIQDMVWDLAARNRLQYLIVYKSKRILVSEISVRSVYHVITNTYNNISKSKQTHYKCLNKRHNAFALRV